MGMGTSSAGRGQARRRAGCLAVALIALALGSCTNPQPAALSEVAYETRAVTQQRDGLAVAAAPLSDHESRAVFGVPLASFDVQPVWIRIVNRSAWPRWFFPASVDPDYYPAYEVARRVASFTTPSVEQLYLRLSERAIKPFVMPGETVSGFVYAHSDEGFKAFNVDVAGHHEIESFHYAVPIPGLQIDADAMVVAAKAAGASLGDAALRRWLTGLPCCATAAGGGAGGPPHLLLVGSPATRRAAPVSRGLGGPARR